MISTISDYFLCRRFLYHYISLYRIRDLYTPLHFRQVVRISRSRNHLGYQVLYMPVLYLPTAMIAINYPTSYKRLHRANPPHINPFNFSCAPGIITHNKSHHPHSHPNHRHNYQFPPSNFPFPPTPPSRTGHIIRRRPAQIPAPDIRQLATLREHRGIRTDVRVRRAE